MQCNCFTTVTWRLGLVFEKLCSLALDADDIVNRAVTPLHSRKSHCPGEFDHLQPLLQQEESALLRYFCLQAQSLPSNFRSILPFVFRYIVKLFSAAFRRNASTPLKAASSLSIAAALTIQQKQAPSSTLPKVVAPLQGAGSRTMHTKVVSKRSFIARMMHNSLLTSTIVIGSGPAAHTAAIYLSRAELKREHFQRSRKNRILRKI